MVVVLVAVAVAVVFVVDAAAVLDGGPTTQLVEVPDGFEVVRVDRIQNLQNWAEFRLRQQEILEEIEKLKENVPAPPNGWSLDGTLHAQGVYKPPLGCVKNG